MDLTKKLDLVSKEHIGLEIDEELYDKLEKRAKEEGISASLLAQRLLQKVHLES